MSEITITINGRNYDISCDPGQEGRVMDLATYVDQRVKEIARSGAAYNDSHLLVLATLFLANEALEVREGILPQVGDVSGSTEQENMEAVERQSELEEALARAEAELAELKLERDEILSVTKNLTKRVDVLSEKVASF